MEAEDIFEYEKLLEDAKKHFAGKEVSSKTIEDWFWEIGLSRYICYTIVEKLMFKLRQDLWNFFSSAKPEGKSMTILAHVDTKKLMEKAKVQGERVG